MTGVHTLLFTIICSISIKVKTLAISVREAIEYNVHSATMHDNLNQSSNVGHMIRLANNIHKAIQSNKVKTLAINVHEAIEYNVHSATTHDNLNQSSNVGHTIRLVNNVHKAIQYKATKLKR